MYIQQPKLEGTRMLPVVHFRHITIILTSNYMTYSPYIVDTWCGWQFHVQFKYLLFTAQPKYHERSGMQVWWGYKTGICYYCPWNGV